MSAKALALAHGPTPTRHAACGHTITPESHPPTLGRFRHAQGSANIHSSICHMGESTASEQYSDQSHVRSHLRRVGANAREGVVIGEDATRAIRQMGG